MRRPYLAGNWKMNLTLPEATKLAEDLEAALEGVDYADIAVCPTYVVLQSVVAALSGSNIAVGGQNLHWEDSGAYTGEISAPMLKAIGATTVIIGHSERRGEFELPTPAELKTLLATKLKYLLDKGMNVILAIGEPLPQSLPTARRRIELFEGIDGAPLVHESPSPTAVFGRVQSASRERSCRIALWRREPTVPSGMRRTLATSA